MIGLVVCLLLALTLFWFIYAARATGYTEGYDNGYYFGRQDERKTRVDIQPK